MKRRGRQAGRQAGRPEIAGLFIPTMSLIHYAAKRPPVFLFLAFCLFTSHGDGMPLLGEKPPSWPHLASVLHNFKGTHTHM